MSDSRGALPAELSVLREGDPARIGPYTVVGRLGAGGMGAVYGGLDSAGHCVAVKVIHQRYAQHGEFRQRFAREARLMERLDAECAPAFLAADVEAASPWLATEFVSGRTVTAHVRELGPLSGGALLAFAAGTAEALSAVHDAGVLHRDIKPGNVMLSPDGPRLVDFGIARSMDEQEDVESVYGTPGYLPPERLDRADSHPAGDVFAWGALVSYAATGRHAYGTGGADQVLRRVRAGVHNLTGLPDTLRPLVERALNPDPALRPTALDCYTQVLALAEPAQPVQDTPQARRRSLRRILAAAWRGFDAAGHDPRTWAALASGVGAGVGTIAALWAQQEAARRTGEAAPSAADQTAESAEAAGGATTPTSPGQLAPNSPSTGPSTEPSTEPGPGPGTPADPAPSDAMGYITQPSTGPPGTEGIGGTQASTPHPEIPDPGRFDPTLGKDAVAGATGGTVTAKTASITCAVVLVTTTGGYFAYNALTDPEPPEKEPVAAEADDPAPTPQELALDAAALLEDGEGFSAEMRIAFTSEYDTAELSDPDLLESGSQEIRLSYSANDPQVFMAEFEDSDYPYAIANVDGEMFVYWTGRYLMIPRYWVVPGEEAHRSLTSEAVASPLRSLGEADDLTLETREDGSYEVSGPLTGYVSVMTHEIDESSMNDPWPELQVVGQVDEEPGTGTLLVDPDGRPLNLEYSTDWWEVDINFTAVDEPVAVEEPETIEPHGGQQDDPYPELEFADPYGPLQLYGPETGWP